MHGKLKSHLVTFCFSNNFKCLQKEHSSSIRVSKESLKLLRALAGNDAVKMNILKNGIAQLINEIINIHKVCMMSLFVELERKFSFGYGLFP